MKNFQINGIIHSWCWNQWTGLFRTGSEDSLVQNLFRSGVGRGVADASSPGCHVLIVAQRPQKFSAAIRQHLIFDHPEVEDGTASISPRQSAQHLFLCFDFC